MNILFIGDIVGRPGRRSVARMLPLLKKEYAIDCVLANAENSAGGLGATRETLQELRDCGVQGFTMGNHVWKKSNLIASLDTMTDIVRPANYPVGAVGKGAAVIPLSNGRKVGIVNLLGRVFMEALDCPFAAASACIETLKRETAVILVDIHAEATSEKVALGWHLNGQCTAVVGTHTHVQTADEWVLPEGTAYITDVGMCGPEHSVIGVKTELVIEKFISGLPRKFVLASGPTIFNAVLIEVDDLTGKAKGIKRIFLRDSQHQPPGHSQESRR